MRSLYANPLLDAYGTIDFFDMYGDKKGSITTRTGITGHALCLGAGEDVQMVIYHDNRVGIGTSLPVGQLGLGEYQGGTAGSVVAGYDKQLVLGGEYNTGYNAGSSVKLLISDYDNDGDADIYPIYCEDEQNRVDFYVRKQDGSVSTAYFGGRVGIRTTDPSASLEIHDDEFAYGIEIEQSGVGGGVYINNTNPSALLSGLVVNYASANRAAVQIYNPGNRGLLVRGTATVDVLEIMGADLAEKFPVTEEVKPGMVLAIDSEHPGKLCLARGAYNRCVAGVVSGANGLPAGAILGNLSSQEEAMPIALSGRVWVYCDATEQTIDPGDLLTTSSTPGHAMKVTDHNKALGAIIGKAMTSLEEDKGMVLVLVSLQ
jgi:hypothetical protein